MGYLYHHPLHRFLQIKAFTSSLARIPIFHSRSLTTFPNSSCLPPQPKSTEPQSLRLILTRPSRAMYISLPAPSTKTSSSQPELILIVPGKAMRRTTPSRLMERYVDPFCYCLGTGNMVRRLLLPPVLTSSRF